MLYCYICCYSTAPSMQVSCNRVCPSLSYPLWHGFYFFHLSICHNYPKHVYYYFLTKNNLLEGLKIRKENILFYLYLFLLWYSSFILISCQINGNFLFPKELLTYLAGQACFYSYEEVFISHSLLKDNFLEMEF